MEETTRQPEKRRRVLSICIAAVLLIGWLVYWICPFPNKFTFYELSDGTYAVSNYDGSFPVAIFPKSYWGKPVSQIYNGIAGLNDTRIAVVPDSVETLTRNVFAGNDKLKTVYLPDTLTMIGSAAFYNCPELDKIEIPQNVNRIGAWAFQQCPSLEQITIPASVTSIGSTTPEDSFVTMEIFGHMFGEDKLGQSYESIFLGCTALKEIIVEESNPSYCSVDGVLFTKDMTELLSYPAAKEGTSYTIPDTVTEIHAGAFADCVHLEEIILPEHLTEIRDMTFYGCKALQKIEIPDTVTQIGIEAFYSCKSLEKIEVSPDNENYTSLDGVLYNKDCTELLWYPAVKSDVTHFRIPETVTTVSRCTFQNCQLTSILYPPSLLETNKESGTSNSIPIGDSETLRFLTIPEHMEEALFKTGDGNVWLIYDCPNLETVYSYSTGRTRSGGENEGEFCLALNGGWFNENWPEDQSLEKEGYIFLGWSTESCTDTDGAGTLPEESGGKVYYAVFTEE